MTTMKEDYVSFETAKLLKEKGFDGECIAYYSRYKDNNANLYRWRNRQNYVDVRNNDYTLVPTLQMAMKWLREIHNLEIYSYHNSPNNRHNSEWWFEIIKYPNSVAEYESGIDEEVDSYEKACEAAIRYCLENLI